MTSGGELLNQGDHEEPQEEPWRLRQVEIAHREKSCKLGNQVFALKWELLACYCGLVGKHILR